MLVATTTTTTTTKGGGGSGGYAAAAWWGSSGGGVGGVGGGVIAKSTWAGWLVGWLVGGIAKSTLVGWLVGVVSGRYEHVVATQLKTAQLRFPRMLGIVQKGHRSTASRSPQTGIVGGREGAASGTNQENERKNEAFDPTHARSPVIIVYHSKSHCDGAEKK
jgi:hypothetical protein